MAEKGSFVVAQVGIFPIKDSIKNQRVKKPGEHFDKQFNIDKTHTVAIKVPELHAQWITIGHRKFKFGDELSWRAEFNGEWKNIYAGSTLFMFYTRNAAGYINIDVGKLDLEVEGVKPATVYGYYEDGDKPMPAGGGAPGTGGGGDYNPVGAINGNAFNGTMILCNDNDEDPKAFSIAMELLKINGELKAETTAVGPAIGMVILSACKQTMDIRKVKAAALRKLNGLIVDIDARKQSGGKPDATPEPEPDPTPDPGIDDSDIPF